MDKAFFVISFAALEKQITSLVCARMDEPRHIAMQDAAFEKRWWTLYGWDNNIRIKQTKTPLTR